MLLSRRPFAHYVYSNQNPFNIVDPLGMIRVLPQNAISSYDYRLYNMSEGTTGHFQKGDFVFHPPGIAYYETCSLLEARVQLFSGEWVKDNMII